MVIVITIITMVINNNNNNNNINNNNKKEMIQWIYDIFIYILEWNINFGNRNTVIEILNEM